MQYAFPMVKGFVDWEQGYQVLCEKTRIGEKVTIAFKYSTSRTPEENRTLQNDS